VGAGIDMIRDGMVRDCVTCRETTPRFVWSYGVGGLDERLRRGGKKGGVVEVVEVGGFVVDGEMAGLGWVC
jgi:hypothetical protein